MESEKFKDHIIKVFILFLAKTQNPEYCKKIDFSLSFSNIALGNFGGPYMET